MTPALETILDAARWGVAVESVGGNLHVSPTGRVTPELANRLRSHKADILEALDDPETTADRIIDAAQDAVDDLRECFDERLAICTIDGGLSESAARRVALEQILRKMALDRISYIRYRGSYG
ncbi:MAG: hypothetical protein ACE5E5_15855 [Phycisphaerae bacterium]